MRSLRSGLLRMFFQLRFVSVSWTERNHAKADSCHLVGQYEKSCGYASYLVFAVWFKVPLDAGILADLAAFVGSARP